VKLLVRNVPPPSSAKRRAFFQKSATIFSKSATIFSKRGAFFFYPPGVEGKMG
jgi:hypothetical protein